MITSTSISHPTFLANIKHAVLQAVNSNCVSCVTNKRNKPVLHVIHTGKGVFRICDNDWNDVTDVVKKALKEYHAKAWYRK